MLFALLLTHTEALYVSYKITNIAKYTKSANISAKERNLAHFTLESMLNTMVLVLQRYFEYSPNKIHFFIGMISSDRE